MAQYGVIIGGGYSSDSTGFTSSVRYHAPVGTSATAYRGTEAEVQVRWPDAGTLVRFYGHYELSSEALLAIRIDGVNEWSDTTTTRNHTLRDVNLGVTEGDLISTMYDSTASQTGRNYAQMWGIETAGQVYTVYNLAGSQAYTATENPTYYLPLNGDVGSNSTVSYLNRASVLVSAADISKMSVYVSANTRNASTPITLQKNGTDTTVTVTVGSTSTGRFTDTTNTVSFAANDLGNYEIDNSSGTGSLTVTGISAKVATATANKITHVCGGASNMTITTTRYFEFLNSNIVLSSTSSPTAGGRIPWPATIDNISVYVSTNTDTSNRTLALSSGTSDLSGFSITLTALTTGRYDDTSFSLDLSNTMGTGIDLEHPGVASTTSTIFTSISYDVTSFDRDAFAAADGSRGLVITGNSLNTPQNPTTGTYYCFLGATGADDQWRRTTEAEVQAKLGVAADLKNFRMAVTANSANLTSAVYTVRDDGVDTAATWTVTSNTTGVFSYTGAAISVASGSYLSLKEVITASGSAGYAVGGLSYEIIRGADLPSTVLEIAQIDEALSVSNIDFPIQGGIQGGTQSRQQFSGITRQVSGFGCYVTANTSTSSTQIFPKTFGADAYFPRDIGIAITASTTGRFDNADISSPAEPFGSYLQYTTTSESSATLSVIYATHTTLDSDLINYVWAHNGGAPLNTGGSTADRFWPISQGPYNANANTTATSSYVPFSACTIVEMRISVTTASTNNATFTLLDDGVDTGLSISYVASTTGIFIDTGSEVIGADSRVVVRTSGQSSGLALNGILLEVEGESLASPTNLRRIIIVHW